MPTRPRAITTTYADCRFRSRLEARWAVFFDQLGVDWVYEPERFAAGLPRATYLPDFWLPSLQAYLEIKGVIDGTEERTRRFAALLSGPACYLAVGDIPRSEHLAMNGWRTVEALTPAFEWDNWFPPGSAFVQAACAGARAERFEARRAAQLSLAAVA